MGRFLFVFLAAVLLAVTAPAEEIVLKSERLSVTIDPERLAFATQGDRLVISAPREKRSRVTDLKHEGEKLQWNLPDEKLTVGAAFDRDTFVVKFKPTGQTKIDWPTLPASASGEAYVLPVFEGAFVPSDDEGWATHLANESPMNTTAGLSMPFWGVRHGGKTLTYILANAFNNELTFAREAGRLTLKLTHEFRSADSQLYELRISLDDNSPLASARRYRQYLKDTGQFVSLQEKIAKTPDVAKLLGAPHVYLWGDGLIGRNDIRDYKAFAKRLPETELGKALLEKVNDETRALIAEILKAEFVDNYQKGLITAELSRLLKERVADVDREKLHDAFPDLLTPVESWGDGFSTKMVRLLADAKIDRAWLGSPNWDGLGDHPEFTNLAIEKGYLVGPYDSYHSIHSPDEKETWETAQFDRELYETGAIKRADGSKRTGFKKKGFQLSPIAARPALEKRVTALMAKFKCNSWFMDCDAFGEVYDDYSPAHPATQADDARARLSRMDWIRDTFGAVIGSEGGSAYAAPVIHFAHGIMTPVMGWGDPDLMKDKQSKFYLGGYFPPDGPAIFFEQVPMKDMYRHIYADARYRLPLYQAVFHDSVVTTHQWGYGSLKFEDPDRTRELLELLYNVPPLYHLNQTEWAKRKDAITKHFGFFSPVHREAGLMPMSNFEWISNDRLVQRATFGDKLDLIANFSSEPFRSDGYDVPAHSITLRRSGSTTQTYPVSH